MAQQQVPAAEAAKRLIAGEQMASVFGVTEGQIRAIVALGYNQYQQGQLRDAETAFRGVIALDSTSYFGYAGIGAVALAKKPPDLETAKTNLSKALELKPDDATIHANLGEVLLRQAKVEEAKKHLEKAFELDRGHKDPGVNRARGIVSGLDIIVKEVEKRLQSKGQVRAKAS